MQSHKIRKAYCEEKQVCVNTHSENETNISGKNTLKLIKNIIRRKKAYNLRFRVYRYNVNKNTDEFGYSGMAEAVTEVLEQLKNYNKTKNDDFFCLQNSNLRNNRNNFNNICINGLIFKRKGIKNVCEELPSMVGSSCKKFSKLNNHLIIKTVSEPCLSFLASSNDFETKNEMFDSLICLRCIADATCKKVENLPGTYIVLNEISSICENQSNVQPLMDNKKLLHKNYISTLFPIFKISSHKNVFNEAKPNLDILLERKTMCNKNKYLKELRERIYYLKDQVNSTCKLYTFLSPTETRKLPKKEKVTNTSITCFVKIPPKSYIKTKKITFISKKKMCKKSRSCACSIKTLTKKCNNKSLLSCEKRVFREKMDKFIALNTLLEDKTSTEKHKIFKCLAQNGVALPTATTICEKKIMNKVQKELAVSKKSFGKSLKLDILRPSRCKSQTNCSFTKKHLFNKNNCINCELCTSINNLNDENITEIFPPPAKRQKEGSKTIKKYIGSVGKPNLKQAYTDKCNLHLAWPTWSRKTKRPCNLKKNCGTTKNSLLVALTMQNYQGRNCSFLKKIKHYNLFNKKKCLFKIELCPVYSSENNYKGLFTNNNKNNVKVTIGSVTVQSMCELKRLRNLIDESKTSKVPNQLVEVNNHFLFLYETSRQIDYRLSENILKNSKINICRKDNINILNKKFIDEWKSSKDLIQLYSTLSQNVTIKSETFSPDNRISKSKTKANLLQNCSPFYIQSKSVIDINCKSLIERECFEDVFTLKCKNHICSFPLQRSHKFVTSKSLPCMEAEFNKNVHYKNVNKIEGKYLSTTMFVIAVDIKKSKNLDILYCNKCLNRSQASISFYGHSNGVQDPYSFKVKNNKGSIFKATSLQECNNAKKNISTKFQVENINSKMTSNVLGIQKNFSAHYATEKHIRFKCPDEMTLHRSKMRSQSSFPHPRRKHTCCIKQNDGVRGSDFFWYPQHKSNTSISMQKKQSMDYKSKRIQTQLSLLQSKTSFFFKDAQNQAKLLEPRTGSFQYRPKKYIIKKPLRGEFDKGKSNSTICKNLRRNFYPPDSRMKRNTSSLSTHNSKSICNETPSPKRILIKGRNKRKWRGMSCDSLGDVKKCWCKILDKYKCRLKEIYSPTYSRSLAYAQNLKCSDIFDNNDDLQQEKKEYKYNKKELTFSDFKELTAEQLKCIIEQLKEAVSNNNEICSHSSFEDNMTSEEEMMFYCDYAASLNNDMLSRSSMDDDEVSAPQGIKLHVRPNSRTLNRKWWSFFINDFYCTIKISPKEQMQI